MYASVVTPIIVSGPCHKDVQYSRSVLFSLSLVYCTDRRPFLPNSPHYCTPMDIKKSLKQKIVNDVLHSRSNNEWSILVYDTKAAQILAGLFNKPDFVEYNIVIAQLLEEPRDSADFPVIYFVNADEKASFVINKEFLSKKYSSYFVCSLCEVTGLDPLIRAKQVYVDYFVPEERIFICELTNLKNVCKSLGNSLSVHHDAPNKELAETILVEGERNGDLIVLDRTVDLYSPFLHFLTFQSMLADMELLEDFDDTIWGEVKHAHIAEINAVLRKHAHTLAKHSKKLDEKLDNKELIKIALEAPTALQTKKALGKYMDLAQVCYEKFKYLSQFIEMEQKIATKIDKSNRPYKIKMDEVFQYIKSGSINSIDKIRLIMLSKASGCSYSVDEKTILSQSGFKVEDLEIEIPNVDRFVPMNVKYKYKYDVSRYTPVLYFVLYNFVKNIKNHIPLYSIGPVATQNKSLRKSYLLSVKKDVSSKKLVVIYVNGGITYSEMIIAYELSEKLGIEVLIGSNKILTAKQYIEDLKILKNKEAEANG